MSLIKYLQAIKGIDPGKIEVENVRSILKTSRFNAKLYCELAVQDGIFEKRIGFVCPNEGKIIADFEYESSVPDYLICNTCENDERENFTFKSSDLETVEFYQIIK